MNQSLGILGKPGKPSGVSFGQGLFFTTVSQIASELSPFGLSERGVRAFLRSLHIPLVRTPSGDHLVNLAQFQLAMSAISRIGSKDFLMPGAPERRRAASKKENMATGLDPTSFERDWETILAELYYAKRLDYTNIDLSLKREFSAAAQTIVSKLAACSPHMADRLRSNLRRDLHHRIELEESSLS